MATIKVMQNGPYLVQGDDVTAVVNGGLKARHSGDVARI
jgi:hypothetical protein